MRNVILAAVAVFVGLVILAGLIDFNPPKPVPAPPDSLPSSQSAGPAANTVLLEVSGSGSKTTQKFTAGSDWDLQWSYSCTGPDGIFGYYLSGDGTGRDVPNLQTAPQGSSVEHYHHGGVIYLQIIATCPWQIKVLAA